MGESSSRVLRALWVLCLLALSVVAARADDDFLDPEKAFLFTAHVLDAQTIEVGFDVAPGYYLYRESLRIGASDASLGTPAFPQGKVKFDETFQKNVETYRGQLRIRVPVESGSRFRVDVTSQGCADKGLCYPPMQSAAAFEMPGAAGGEGHVQLILAGGSPLRTSIGMASIPMAAQALPEASATGLGAVLESGHFWSVVGLFFAAGLLLSLTPCVLPMLPIVSSIIAGDDRARSRGRGLALSLSYSIGMAIVYTALGIAAGLAGEGLAATLQNPWVLGVFALLLVAFALSMLGVFELRPPSAFTNRLTVASGRLPPGRLAGVFAMGGVSALIVSPCVAAPLAGALLYLSQTRNVALGGMALFSLAIGMSMPLLLIGASAGAWLPRSGEWMTGVKHFFGLLLLGVAVWTIQPVVPAWLALVSWGALSITAAVMVRPFGSRSTGPRRVASLLLALLGLSQIVGAATGSVDPLRPLAALTGRHGDADGAPRFTPVRSVAELDAALQSSSRTVILDFSADWCVSCKEMERFTFADAAVRKRLAGATLLRADVTANSDDDRAMLRRFHLFGPPAMIFFDATGHEIDAARVIGFQDSSRFRSTLKSVGL